MDVMGEVLETKCTQLLRPGEREAELSGVELNFVIDEVFEVAAGLTAIVENFSVY